MIRGCPDPPPRATRTLPWMLLKHQLSRCDRSKAPTMPLRSSWIWMMIKSQLSLQVNKLEHGLTGKETSCAQVGNIPGDTREDVSAGLVRSTSPTLPFSVGPNQAHDCGTTGQLVSSLTQSRISSYIPFSMFMHFYWHKNYLLHNIDSSQKLCTMGRILTHWQNQPEGRV